MKVLAFGTRKWLILTELSKEQFASVLIWLCSRNYKPILRLRIGPAKKQTNKNVVNLQFPHIFQFCCSKKKESKQSFPPELNWRPCACQADVITTTLWKPCENTRNAWDLKEWNLDLTKGKGTGKMCLLLRLFRISYYDWDQENRSLYRGLR